ncbi:MAG: NAD-dependent epimerase/dehydratase family protein [Acidimicrobiales bacterium]|nr:NAD-dependent epimerase/dehydratase family protein [Acidimicrobiales bacterium]
MARIAVTGGTGFVGANLVRRLLGDGHEVHLLVRPGHHRWRLDDVAGDLRWRAIDLAHRDELATLVRVLEPEQVFHLAAHGAYSWQTDHGEIFATNVVATDHLLAACRAAGVPTLVHAGSSSEYGAVDHAPSEGEAVRPNSYYALTKAWATLAVQHAGYTAVRLYSVYGPWEDPRRLVPTLVEHGLEGRLPPLADPSTARDFVHVDDVVEALVRAAAAPPPPGGEPGPIYNIGTGTQTTLREAVEEARRLLGVEAEPRWATLAPRGWDTDVWVADPSLARERLGWRATLAFDEGLAAVAAWQREQMARSEGGPR